MAKDKKGFILYADQKELFEQLPNDKAGELIKHIFSYVNDDEPTTEDLLIKLAFTPIKQQFKRDLQKWETTREGRVKAGKASAEARKNKSQQTQTKSTNVKSVQQTSTNPTVNDNVNVNVKDKDIKDKETKFLIWFNLRKKELIKGTREHKTLTKTDSNNLKALRKNYSIEDFDYAIKMMSKNEWVIENNMFNPQHFLRADNFNKYYSTEEQINSSNRLSSKPLN